MHETLVIAGTYERAEQIAHRMALAVAPNQIIRDIYGPVLRGPNLRAAGFDWTGAGDAIRHMEGRRYDRIVIGQDWIGPRGVRWSLPYGHWSGLWYSIQTQVAHGAERVWA